MQKPISTLYVSALAVFGECGSAVAATSAFVYSAKNQYDLVNLASGAYFAIGTPDVLLGSITSLDGPQVLGVDNSSNLVPLDIITGFPILGANSAVNTYIGWHRC